MTNPHLDLTVDGTDEFDAEFRLIKGGGGALLREKIVASSSRLMVVIADESKKVKKLGKFPLAGRSHAALAPRPRPGKSNGPSRFSSLTPRWSCG